MMNEYELAFTVCCLEKLKANKPQIELNENVLLLCAVAVVVLCQNASLSRESCWAAKSMRRILKTCGTT